MNLARGKPSSTLSGAYTTSWLLQLVDSLGTANWARPPARPKMMLLLGLFIRATQLWARRLTQALQEKF